MGAYRKTRATAGEMGDLASRIAAGDHAAEALLYEKYAKAILFLLQQRCNSPMLAEDLLHETFRIVIERLRAQALDDPNKLTAYMHRVAINLAIGEIRKSQRRNTVLDTDTVNESASLEPGIIEKINKEQIASLIRRQLKEMKVERDRELLRLYFVLEYDKADICERLDLTPQHFDRVLYRAKQRFRQLVEDDLKKYE
ncbi:MAG: hypothetical protein Tsb002_05440 [Wenzhouxiangellaceae bacterium]